MMTLPTIALAAFSLTASVGVSEDQLRGSGMNSHSSPAVVWNFVGSFATKEGEQREVIMTQTKTKAECEELVENNKDAAADHHVTLSCKEDHDD